MQQSGTQKWAVAAISYRYPLQVKRGLSAPKEGESQFVRITLEGGGKISGIVEHEGRGPLASVRVTVSPRYVDAKQRKKDARQGRYVFTDLAGHFELSGRGCELLVGTPRLERANVDGSVEVRAGVGIDPGQGIHRPTRLKRK